MNSLYLNFCFDRHHATLASLNPSSKADKYSSEFYCSFGFRTVKCDKKAKKRANMHGVNTFSDHCVFIDSKCPLKERFLYSFQPRCEFKGEWGLLYFL